MVYFLLLKASNLIKIGRTTQFNERLRDHRVCYNEEIVVLGVRAGDRTEERRIHLRWREYRVDVREHFEPHPDLMDYIREHTYSVEEYPYQDEVLAPHEKRRPDVAKAYAADWKRHAAHAERLATGRWKRVLAPLPEEEP